ncbi:MAG: hypothetical protein ACOC5R_04135 [Elusimicrobiota bacterium]
MKKLFFIFFLAVIIPDICSGKIILSELKGKVRIARPQQEVIAITGKEELEEISSGSWIRVVEGSGKIKANGLLISINENNWFYIEKSEQEDSFLIRTARHNRRILKITSQDSYLQMKDNQEAKITVVKKLGIMKVECLEGTIKVVSPDETIEIAKGEETWVKTVDETITNRIEELIDIVEEPEEEEIVEEEASPYQP